MSKGGKSPFKTVCSNKRARREYHIEDNIEAGLVLWGNEVKSLREGKANLQDAYARIKDNEVWLTGMHITPYTHARIEDQDPTRDRKLLLNRSEIKKLSIKILERGYSLVPLKIYFKGGRAKVELGLGKGKNAYDKRDVLKKMDAQREIERAVKDRSDY